jgi:hypothetical protein
MSVKRKTAGIPVPEPPSLERQTALEMRAARMEWSELDLMIRKEIAGAARAIRNHRRRHNPGTADFFTYSAILQMRQAANDCRVLDQALAARGSSARYLPSLIFNHPAALSGIHCRTLEEYRELTDRKTPAFKAMADGCKSTAYRKRALEVIRESLRDGYGADDALRVNEGWIREMVSVGDAKFFEELGDLLRKHRQDPIERGLTEWIVRSWLTLCLWECPANSYSAYSRFKEAANLLGVQLHNLPPIEKRFFKERFERAWKNVRAKTMNARRGA